MDIEDLPVELNRGQLETRCTFSLHWDVVTKYRLKILRSPYGPKGNFLLWTVVIVHGPFLRKDLPVSCGNGFFQRNLLAIPPLGHRYGPYPSQVDSLPPRVFTRRKKRERERVFSVFLPIHRERKYVTLQYIGYRGSFLKSPRARTSVSLWMYFVHYFTSYNSIVTKLDYYEIVDPCDLESLSSLMAFKGKRYRTEKRILFILLGLSYLIGLIKGNHKAL